MKVDVKEISSVKKEITAEFDWDEVKDIYNNIVNEEKNNFKMNGFRPGKVPVNIVKRQAGQKIKYKTLNTLFQEYNDKVFEKADINMDEILDYSIVDVEFEEGQPFTYKITTETDPEVDLFDYKEGLSMEKKEYKVDEEDVDLYIDEMKERSAQARVVTDGAEMGHYIKCDLQEIDDSGVPIVGNKIEDQNIKLGEGPFQEPGVSNLIGAKEGDEREIFIETDAGEKVNYKVDVKEVEEHLLPEINDEWVEENIETVDTLEEWKDQIKNMLKDNWDQHSEQEFDSKIKEYFINNIDIEIPEARVKYYLDQIVKDAKNRSQQQEIDEEAIRKNKRKEAEQNVKWHLISSKIKEELGIEATDEEIEEKLDEMVQQYPEEQRGQIKTYYSNNEELKRNLELQVEEEKLMDHIKQYIDIDKETISTSEARKQAHH